MLIKLLRYDLKYMLKNMLVFYAFLLIFSIVTRVLFALDQSFIVNFLSQISVGVFFAMVISVLINTIIRSFVRFIDSIYKDEGYLIHTLPVTKADIYNSKNIQTLIFFVISFLLVVISLFIAYYTPDRWLLLKDGINNFISMINFSPVFCIFSLLFLFFVELFNIVQCGYLGILLGYRKNSNRTFFSIFFGLSSYMLSQALVLFLIFVFGLFNENIMNFFISGAVIDGSSFKLLIFIVTLLYIFIISIINLLCKMVFNKGVNLD